MVMESRVHNLLALCVGIQTICNLLSKKQGFSFPPFETFTTSPSMRPFHVFKTVDFILAGAGMLYVWQLLVMN